MRVLINILLLLTLLVFALCVSGCHAIVEGVTLPFVVLGETMNVVGGAYGDAGNAVFGAIDEMVNGRPPVQPTPVVAPKNSTYQAPALLYSPQRPTQNRSTYRRPIQPRPTPKPTRPSRQVVPNNQTYQPALPPSPPKLIRKKGDISVSKEKVLFLISELEEMINILATSQMSTSHLPSSPGILEPGVLVSWLVLERPESQSAYYRTLGIPISYDSKLKRTKSELNRITNTERINLRNYLIQVLKNLKDEYSWQRNSNMIGISKSCLP